MKILIHSDPHISNSGYGIQTSHVVKHLQEQGHTVIIVPKSGLIMTCGCEIDGYVYYPQMNQWGNGGVNAAQKKFKPDLFISNLDPWITKYDNPKNWIAWAPIDHDPIPPGELEKLKQCLLPVALTRYSEKQMKDAGLDPVYCPYGIDTKILYPDEEKRKQTRAKFGLKDDDYLIGMVGVNQFERKGYGQAFLAFKEFKKTHPNAYLYIHTDPLDPNGHDLYKMAESIGIDAFMPDVFQYREGMFTEELAYLYNAFDVMLTTTHGEGFGIPIIEAQACGVPVISTYFMGIPELNPYGQWIDCQPEYSPHESWTVIPIIEDVVDCMERMYQKQPSKEVLVEFAKQYDFENIYALFDKAIETAVERFERNNHEHVWCQIGNHSGKEIHVPCMVEGCEVGLVVTEDKPNEIRQGLYKPHYNGVDFDIEDDPISGVKKVIIRELPLNQIEEIGLTKDSVVIDVGAQVGIVSSYIAKKFGCGVLAFEPMPDNYKRLKRNIKAMGVDNLVLPINKAVFNGKPIKLSRRETNLTGSASISLEGTEVESVDLNDILDHLDYVDLLKIDTEGSEYEILYTLSERNFKKIRHIRGEFHTMPNESMDDLLAYTKKYVPDTKVVFSGLTA